MSLFETICSVKEERKKSCFALVLTFSTNSRGNACYADYIISVIRRDSFSLSRNDPPWWVGSGRSPDVDRCCLSGQTETGNSNATETCSVRV